MKSETTVFNGVTYYRYPESKQESDRKYFKRRRGYLHRDVWELHHGKIPDGYEIHHKDKDTSNNAIENLELVASEQHIRLYHCGSTPKKKTHLERIRPLTKEWHASEEGREWHREHAKAQYAALPIEERACDHCQKVYPVKWNRVLDRFCSNRCKTAARYASGVDNIEHTCVVCSKTFTRNRYARGTHQYCSRQCSAVGRRGVSDASNRR
jgi:hypothetical protein